MKIINLFESMIPDPSSFITDETINDIINNERWTHHGDDGTNWIRFLQDDERFQDMEDQVEHMLWHGTDHDKETFYSSPEFLTRFKDYLHVRTKYIREEQFSMLYPDSSIERVMMVSESVISRIESNHPPHMLGRYWSDQTGDAYWGDRYNENMDMLRVYVRLGNVQVNWYETVRARLDWVIGLEENEIQLVENSRINPPVRFEWQNYEGGEPVEAVFKIGRFIA